ncbi:MAG: phosphoribosylamine--glycine ligase [Chloroflexota bacterium]
MGLPVAPTRILVVGGGGREHALAWRLAGEPGVNEVVVGPGSAAIAAEPRVAVVPLDPLDPAAVVAAARARSVELVVVGPEAPLAAGVADACAAAGIPVFGPTREGARLETSKAFCREVAEAAGVRMARGRAFADHAAARAFAAELAASGDGVVVKADGLAAGKGVTVCATLAEAEAALAAIFADGATAATTRTAVAGRDPRVVVEERLTGPEASVIALTDGRDAVALPPARDHKRLLDGDEGPNTGGMGAYSPLPDLDEAAAAALVAAIHRPLLAELARRGIPYRGALYAGLILTRDGPALLECNARFGDPETQALLPRLGVALGPLLLAAARGELGRALAGLGIEGPLLPATRRAAVSIVLAAAGYPADPRAGDPIEGLEAAASDGALVFHAGTRRDPDRGFVTAGGRVLSVVGLGDDLPAARAAAEAAADRIGFAGAQRRRDIAAPGPLAAAAVPLAGTAGR